MANQNQRKTIADEFSEQYTNPELRTASKTANYNRGISNVQVVRAAAIQEERRQITRFENNQRELEGVRSSAAYKAGRQVGRMKATVTTNLARVRATPVVVEIAIWYWPWYIFELILAVLATISFGVAAWLYTVTDPVALEVLSQSWSGLGVEAFFFVFLGLSGFIFFFRVCQIAIATLQFKVILIHPWFGEGAGFKITTLMLTLIGSLIPMLQLFPVFWLWIIAVLWNPK
jgi:hypothetical protein